MMVLFGEPGWGLEADFLIECFSSPLMNSPTDTLALPDPILLRGLMLSFGLFVQSELPVLESAFRACRLLKSRCPLIHLRNHTPY